MLNKDVFRRCDGHTRRELLRVGGLTALGLGLGDFFRLRHAMAARHPGPGAKATANSCILIWLDGGPSHLETFDPKPNAPLEVRGPLQSISTLLPGVQISECLARTATLLDKLCIVRSMTSPLGEHNFGTHYLMTGYKPTPVLEYPTLGAVTSHVRHSHGVLPPHVAIPNFYVGGGNLTGSGFLPSSTRPFAVGSDPAKPDFRVRDLDFFAGIDLERLDRRRQFVQALDAFSRSVDRWSGAGPGVELQRAYQLIASESAKQAFDLDQENDRTRRRYGDRTVGQSCLLARRLVERGVPFVTVNHRGWDTHENLYTRLKEGYTGAEVGVGLIPSLDLALSGLIEDLDDRGMLDETLIVVMGEFGRTPKLNTMGGRDHWPRVFSVALAGGGVRGGQVVGRSDAVGESAVENPVTPADLAATIYSLLGIDPNLELNTTDGRPVRVTPHAATVVSEVIA